MFLGERLTHSRTWKKFHKNHAREGYGKIWSSVGSNVGAGHLSTLTLLQNFIIFTLTLLQSAGSPLEFAIKEVERFPVGRVEFLYLYPLNFSEYLQAINHIAAFKHLGSVPLNPKRDIGDGNLANLPKVYESIWATH
jgi:hypothetical protein